ncbi:MAG TPA: zinc ribbon domain-containing protein [Pyrinomonadaceae bacterium]|jgi:hypothetical protein
MAEIVVENQVCKTCGAEIRPNALFCYNCGGLVAESPIETESKNGSNESSNALIIDNDEVVEKTLIVEKNDENRKSVTAEKTKLSDTKSGIVKEAKLKSAASLRNKAKSFQRKEVEVVWEEAENTSGFLLPLIALLLTVFAVAVVILAIYLK